MEYPHRKYLVYLLSRKMEVTDVRASCLVRGLVPPDEEDLTCIFRDEFGDTLPSFWKAKVSKGDVKFRRWLRDHRLLHLWKRDAAVQEAFALLEKRAVRKDFEAIVLAHGNVEQAHRELESKYPEHLVPSEAGLMRYCEVFWDLGQMSTDGIMDYITTAEDREDYIPALQGDLVTTYGKLGLQQRITEAEFMQNVLEMANQQALIARQNPYMSGANKAGTSSLIKLGLEVRKMRQERDVIDAAETDMREEAADFLAAMVHAPQIPSIDELEGVTDAEAAEAGNVHVLPVRREP